MLWFYLIDPEITPIISTSLVAPQQKKWIREALNEYLDARLPHEIVDCIIGHCDWLITDEEAEEERKKYALERERFVKANDSYHFCIPFDVWTGQDVFH